MISLFRHTNICKWPAFLAMAAAFLFCHCGDTDLVTTYEKPNDGDDADGDTGTGEGDTDSEPMDGTGGDTQDESTDDSEPEPEEPSSGGATLEWVIQAGGPLEDKVRSLDVYPDGSFVVSGTYGEDPPEELDPAGGSAVFAPGEENEETLTTTLSSGSGFVARYSDAGALLWVKSLSETVIAYSSVAAGTDGSVILAGGFYDGELVLGEGEASETAFSSDTTTGIVARLDAQGELVFAVGIDGGDYGEPTNVCTFNDGAVLAVGSYRGETTFGIGTENETVLDDGNAGDIGESSVFLAKYEADGTLSFVVGENEVFGSNLSVTCLEDGAFVVSGMAVSGDNFGQGGAGGTVLYDDNAPGEKGMLMHFIARYDDTGTLAWVDGFSAFYFDNTVTAKPDGNVLWLVENEIHEIDSDGETLAIQSLIPVVDFSSPVYFDNIQYSPDGAIVVAGVIYENYTFGQGEPNETQIRIDSEDTGDLIVAKYQEDGSLLWAEWAGGADRIDDDIAFSGEYYGENALALAVDDDASVLVSGVFDLAPVFDSGDPNQTTLEAAGMSDIFVAKYLP